MNLPILIDHLKNVLKISKDEDIGVGAPHWEGVRSKVEDVAVGGGRGGGEHSVKRFMNIKVKSSKEEVKVHVENKLVSELSKLGIPGILYTIVKFSWLA